MAKPVKKEKDTKELTDAWREYLDVMMSGTATTEEMTEATEKLAQEYIEDALASNALNPDTKNEYIAQLKSLGITNASEYVEDLLQKNMAKDLEEGRGLNISAIRDKFFEEWGNDAIGRDMFNKLTQDQLEEYAKKYGIVDSGVTEAHKQEIMERYGVDEEAIDAVIAKINEKAELEQDLADAQKKQDAYNDWRNGKDGFAALQQDIGAYKTIVDEYNAFSEKAKTFNVREWGLVGGNYGTTMRNSTTGEEIGIGEFRQLEAQAKAFEQWKKQNEAKYNEYVKLKQQYDALWQEGLTNGYIDENGDILDQNFEQLINDAKDGIAQIEQEIDEDVTIDIQLQLDLQNKSELVDDIQNVFDTLVNAQKEYDETGYISVDTLQTLLQLEPKYLDLLVDEEGNLNLTKDALYNVARARIIDMGIQSQKNILEKATALASEGSSEALREQITVMQTMSELIAIVLHGGADFVEVEMAKIRAILAEKVAAGDLTQTEADAFVEGTMNQIKAVQVATQSALDNLNNSLSSSGNTATQEANDAFKDAMDYWENRIGAKESQLEQVQNEIDMLEATGKKAGAGYFAEQLGLLAGDGGKLSLLNQQLGEAQVALAQVPEGSEDWWTIANTINDIHNEIDQTTMAVQDLKDAMADTHWYMFDEAHDRVSTLASDLENIRDILSHEEFFDDEGNFTKEGLGYLATYVNDLGVFEGALAHAKTELDLFRNDDGELSYDPNKQYVDAFGNDLSIDSEQDFYDAVEKAEGVYDDLNNKVIETRYNIKDLSEQQIDAIEESVEV